MEFSPKSRGTWPALCIAVFMMTASAEGVIIKEAAMFTSLDSVGYYFTMEIMNRVYNNSLLDPKSPDYQKMYNEVSSALYSIYGSPNSPTKPSYQGVQEMSFRNGSVIAESTVTFNRTMTNSIMLKYIFNHALLSNSEIDGLQIKLDSIDEKHASTTKSPIENNPSSDHGEGVPGWAIALLVLASIAILLLIIIIIILLIRWCCVDDSDEVRSLPPQEHTPYMRTTFREPLSVPAYSPHTPQKSLYPFEDLTQSPKPKPNRTGTYVVNPER
ncbi:hypothetical protein Q7C36_003891 [Tachysurus vachellii]|uniref:Mucin-1 n=1 Tax=Tachysurus vachellii TaxID=175792 RepID=A0AA88NQV4_TACVA|nr:hypothetical protein Q7C36_003891 [Tachysurus vachellii]